MLSGGVGGHYWPGGSDASGINIGGWWGTVGSGSGKLALRGLSSASAMILDQLGELEAMERSPKTHCKKEREDGLRQTVIDTRTPLLLNLRTVQNGYSVETFTS